MEIEERFLTRPAAAEYLKKKFGFGSKYMLAKMAVYGGGPVYHRPGLNAVYAKSELDSWGAARLGCGARTTSEHSAAARGAA